MSLASAGSQDHGQSQAVEAGLAGRQGGLEGFTLPVREREGRGWVVWGGAVNRYAE